MVSMCADFTLLSKEQTWCGIIGYILIIALQIKGCPTNSLHYIALRPYNQVRIGILV